MIDKWRKAQKVHMQSLGFVELVIFYLFLPR